MTPAFDPEPRDRGALDAERRNAPAQDAELLVRIGNALASELDLERLAQRLSDEATRAVGAQLGAFFYGTREDGDLLYSVSGAPREAFAGLSMPPTFAGKGAMRIDDARASPSDGQNASHRGLPAGHLPVAGYLAVPVLSRAHQGEVLGTLFLGHPEPGRFSERDERVASLIASQAATAIDNARLFARIRAGELERARRAELSTLAADVGRILTRGGSLEHALARFAELVETQYGAIAARLWLNEDGQLALHSRAGSLARPASDAHPGPARVARERAALTLDDGADAELRFFAGVPLESDDALAGVVCFRAARPIALETLHALRPVGSLLALGIERARHQAQLRRSELQHRLVVEAAQAGLWFWDIRRDSVEWNDRLLEMLGIRREEWGGDFLAWFARVHPDDQPVLQAALEAHLARRAPYHVAQFRLRHADGEYRVCTTRGQAEWDEEGRALHMAGAVSDITEQVRAEAALTESEHRHRQILDSVRDMVFSKSRSSRILYANEACCEHYGMSLDALRARPDLHAAKQASDEARVFEAGEVVEELEEPSVRSDGETRYFHVVKSPIFDQSGKVVELVGVARDITEKKRDDDDRRFLAEASAVLASSIDYRETLANVARLAVPRFADWCAIDLLDDDGSIQRVAVSHVDPTKVQLAHDLHRRFPLDPAAIHGVPEVVRSGTTEIITDISDQVLSSLISDPELLAIIRELGLRSSMVVPLTAHRKTLGTLSLISAESKRVYDERAASLAEDIARRAAIAVENAKLFDATQRALAQRDQALEALRQLNLDLEDRVEIRTAMLAEANRELESFSYTVSHDLRAPIRHISGFVDLLSAHAGDSLDEKSRRWLRTIGDASKRMGSLIDGLLAFSRMGRAELMRERVRLGEVTRAAIEELAPDLAERRIEWTLGALPDVRGDLATLRLVMTNLVANAVKYTRHREVAHIEIGATERDDEIEVFVRDDGVGFDMQYAHKLFGVFSRLHASDEFEGTGIGLATVRRVVQRHGGRTWAEGAPDRGATFFFTLPRSRSLA